MNTNTALVTQTGVFITLTILMSYIFAIHTTFIHITFGFIPTALFSIMHGPLRAGIMAGIASCIGMFFFGKGVFFPGFILSDFLTGAVYGYFLYKKPITIKTICIPELIVTICIHLGLNTLWLTIFYDKAMSAIFMGRLIKNIICFPLEVGLIFIIYKTLSKFIHKNNYN
ncbi:MAG: folate family ECF transporter S component [Veillonella sp.]|nr:folate family ECF transporter S component [Veillonella sp.]